MGEKWTFGGEDKNLVMEGVFWCRLHENMEHMKNCNKTPEYDKNNTDCDKIITISKVHSETSCKFHILSFTSLFDTSQI